MSTLSLAFGQYDLPDRNRRAANSIQSYAFMHAGTDAILGLAGFLPIPGAGAAAIGAALIAQIPMYKSLAKDLSNIYQSPEDTITNRYLYGGMALDSALTVGADVVSYQVANLADQFGQEFLTEIAGELFGEMAAGFAASFIPLFGGLFSMGLDVVIATTMTWRVGTMISIYYQNGARWINSRKETYERAKDLTGGLSPRIEGRVDLDKIRQKVPEVREQLVQQTMLFVKKLRRSGPDASTATILQILGDSGFPDDIAQEAVNRVFRES